MREFNYLKLNEKKWDGEILGLVAQIHEFKGRHELYLKQKLVELGRLVEIAKIQSVQTSNMIEGIITTDTRIKQLCMDKTMPKTRDEQEILGYRDVLNTIHENFEYMPIKPSYILHLHRDLYQYSNKSVGGRYKNTQNYISEQRMDGSSFARFVPLAPYQTPSAIEAICESYNKAIDDCVVDPLLLIPIFITDFLCIHPFNDGNGRMSRLLTTLLLYRNGYIVGKYISLESKIEKNKDLYYDALQESGIGWNEGVNDSTAFIKYFLGIVLSAYRDLENRIESIGVKRNGEEIVRSAVKSKSGKFTKRDMMELCPSLSKATIENVLKKLIELEEIQRHGNGKNTFYTRNFK